ncbi:DUF169 domain-containing protein [Methanobrevibacter sp. DSM 116169]|uniref:DUF169 domain-containing protein n=1 Tax=Methanobrevibacter sp. DSM 116169 TaxID=3242727 RepID=UPI0038FC9385
MDLEEFKNCLKLENKILSVILSNDYDASCVEPKHRCIISDIDNLDSNDTLKISKDNLKCPGANCGAGFYDGNPQIPGGFEYFLSYGKGENYPTGERVKKTPEIASEMFENQPKDIINNNKYILIKHFKEDDEAQSVILKVNLDQLSVLIYLFNFESSIYDPVYTATSAGCASVFRIPLYESLSGQNKGVISNLDISSRIYTDKDEVYFTVPGVKFKKMLENAGESLLITKEWEKIRKRIKN